MDAIKQIFLELTDIHTGRPILETSSLKTHEDGVFELVLQYPAQSHHAALEAQLNQKLSGLDPHRQIQVSTEIESRKVKQELKPMPGVKNIIAVASGKGGVGKSTLSANLACAIAQEGGRVGLLDADIYGPSQPLMLGKKQSPKSVDGKKLEPLLAHGIQFMSIGLLIDDATPMIWRGPMVTQALEQLLRDTSWDDLDYLIIDLPPGTGDTQLTLAQKVPVTAAIIVTTPQDIALLDARKAYRMFEKVDIPVLGIVENMSVYTCENCGHQAHIFGRGGAEKIAKEFKLDVLGHLPLTMRIREDVDAGKPTVAAVCDDPISLTYKEIGRKITARLALLKKDYSTAFPTIRIEKN